MPKKTICVLGGGIGGVVAASRLKKKLGAKGRVVLIDKYPDHLFQPSLLNVLAGKRRPDQIKRSLRRLERKGIEFIQAEITNISPQAGQVIAGGNPIDYDYLVVALGAQLNVEAVDGLAEAAINLYSLEGVDKIREALSELRSGEVVIVIPSMPYKCPAAPYEAAFLIDAELNRRGVREKVGISIYTFEPLPMPTAGPDIGRAVKNFLDGRGIGFYPETTIKSADPKTKDVVLGDGARKAADLLIAVPPHKAADVVKASGLGNEAGWIPVNKANLETEYGNIYAIGDAATIQLEGRYKPDKPLMLPKAGVFAEKEAEIVADNIVGKIRQTAPGREFDGRGSCFLELGDGTAGFAAGDFFAVPQPVVRMRKPSRLWHWSKAAYERYWFWRWF